jgi:hypothetical protein
MFGKKKTEEIKPEEKKTETVEVKGQPTTVPPMPNLGALLWVEFAKDYNNFFAKEDMLHMTSAEVEALKLNLLVGIYGELRLIRDSTKQ